MGAPRTLPGSVLFTTYNLLDLFLDCSAAGQERYRLVVGAVRAIDPDVLAVQEIRAPDEAAAQRRLAQFAADTGLACLVPGPGGAAGRPALVMGSHGYHLGLAWRDGITPVPGSLRARSQDLWHALGSVLLDVGGQRVRHATYHAPPFGRRMRVDESELVVAAFTRPPGGPPVLVGADWNGESADRVLPGPASDGPGSASPGSASPAGAAPAGDGPAGPPAGDSTGWRLYEPGDPYQGVAWFGDMVYQCEWDYDERGRRRHRVDRGPGEVLWAGGLHDVAAALRAPWQATTGHHPDDPYAVHGVRRRIDAIRVTAPVLSALRGYHVLDTAAARAASDHLPVTVEYLPAGLRPAG